MVEGAIVGELNRATVIISLYEQQLVSAFNGLQNLKGCSAAVVSDSPKDYCLEVLRLGGYKIDPRLVFGAQHKPLIDFENFESIVAEVLNVEEDELEYLVVGDSPKDIYFAHSIKSPSIFAGWGSKHDPRMVRHARPTLTANNFAQLKDGVDDFLCGNLKFENYSFSQDYLTLDIDDVVRVKLDDVEIGYGREYIPSPDNYRPGPRDKYASQDLKWVVKKAKNYTEDHHRFNRPMTMYGANGVFSTASLKVKAGYFKLEFLEWCKGHGIKGNILLIPVPPSVPRECNLTHTMDTICTWWADWINKESKDLNIQVHDVFERYLPRQPSHLSTGRRDMDEHFETLGVFAHQADKIEDVDYVVIVDDVVTSGAHMNAIASFIRTAELVEEDARILGYALFKTVHPENEVLFDIDF